VADEPGGSRRGPFRQLDERAARLVAADLLARRPWTRADLTRRLVRRGAPGNVAAAVVTDLTTRGYLDDAAYARQWVETRSVRGYGAARLRAELRARGVDAAVVHAAIGGLAPDAALARAVALARRRLPVIARGRPERVAVRLSEYLLRRGYAAGVVVRVVRELTRASAPADQGFP
jgi:regulatory protein